MPSTPGEEHEAVPANDPDDAWDGPESELTRELTRAIEESPERFVMSERLKRIQSHAIRTEVE